MIDRAQPRVEHRGVRNAGVDKLIDIGAPEVQLPVGWSILDDAATFDADTAPTADAPVSTF